MEAAKNTEAALQLPIARIRTIMKSSPEVNTIGTESLFLITKANLISSRLHNTYGDVLVVLGHIIAEGFSYETSRFVLQELFVQELARMSLVNSATPDSVDYNDLADIVDQQETLQFLQDIIPKKIKYSEYLNLVKKDHPSSSP